MPPVGEECEAALTANGPSRIGPAKVALGRGASRAMVDEVFGWGYLAAGAAISLCLIPRIYKAGGLARWYWITFLVPYWITYLSYWFEQRDFGTAFLLAGLHGAAIPLIIYRVRAGPTYSNVGRRAQEKEEAARRKSLAPFISKYRDEE
jgi:hypothetical protein